MDNNSVVQPWLSALSFKQQTVLLAAFRGCDGQPKNDPSEIFARRMRSTILKDADPSTSFHALMQLHPSLENGYRKEVDDFFIHNSPGHYPVHWLLHMLHAAEIVAYHCPDLSVRSYWAYFYHTGVTSLHFNPETPKQLDIRLADKIKG